LGGLFLTRYEFQSKSFIGWLWLSFPLLVVFPGVSEWFFCDHVAGATRFLFAELGLALVGGAHGPWLIPFLPGLFIAIIISLFSRGADCHGGAKS